MARRVQFTFTFTNAQPGASVDFGPQTVKIFGSATDPEEDGRRVLDSNNSVTVWADADHVIAMTTDGQGEPLNATARRAAPSVTTDEGTAGTNPFGSGSGTSGTFTDAVTIRPADDDVTPLSLKVTAGTALGGPVLNIEYPDGTPNDGSGYGLTHLDSDGGGNIGRVGIAAAGDLVADIGPAGQGFQVKDDGSTAFSVEPRNAFHTNFFGRDAAQQLVSLFPYTDATGDVFVSYDAASGVDKTFFVKANGEVNAPEGVVLTSPNSTKYRLVVANDGTLSTVAV